MSGRLRILFTNLSLTSRSGTEMYVRDLAVEMLRQGHEPFVYSPLVGDVAVDLEAAGVRVYPELSDRVPRPDVIHGHHHIELMTALLHFPAAPGIFICHDQASWHDQPPVFPRVLRYLAVDERCRKRMMRDVGGDIPLLFNAVDLERFRPRGPLPRRPGRALLFSHQATARTHLPVIEEVCRRARLELDVIGSGCGQPCARPEEILPRYDVVFAKARCALEAMACGCAVVLCDSWGAGPMVRMSDWERLRTLNFGRSACLEPLRPETLLRELTRYDPVDAAEVCEHTRAHAGVAALAERLVAVYREVIAARGAAPGPGDWSVEARAAAAYLRQNLSYSHINRFLGLDVECDSWKESAEQGHRGWAESHREYERLIQDPLRMLFQIVPRSMFSRFKANAGRLLRLLRRSAPRPFPGLSSTRR